MVVWFTIKTFHDIPSVLAEIRERFGSLNALIPIGTDPQKLSGNYRVLLFKKGSTTIKIEGPLEIIYEVQNRLKKPN